MTVVISGKVVLVGIIGVGVGVGGKVMVGCSVRGDRGDIVPVIVIDIHKGGRIIFGKDGSMVHQRHVVVGSNGFNAGNDGVGYREDDPRTSVDALTGGQGHEVIIATGVASWIGCDSTKCTRLGIVGRPVENLDVGPKLQLEVPKVGFGLASNDSGWG